MLDLRSHVFIIFIYLVLAILSLQYCMGLSLVMVTGGYFLVVVLRLLTVVASLGEPML